MAYLTVNRFVGDSLPDHWNGTFMISPFEELVECYTYTAPHRVPPGYDDVVSTSQIQA